MREKNCKQSEFRSSSTTFKNRKVKQKKWIKKITSQVKHLLVRVWRIKRHKNFIKFSTISISGLKLEWAFSLSSFSVFKLNLESIGRKWRKNLSDAFTVEFLYILLCCVVFWMIFNFRNSIFMILNFKTVSINF